MHLLPSDRMARNLSLKNIHSNDVLIRKRKRRTIYFLLVTPTVVLFNVIETLKKLVFTKKRIPSGYDIVLILT